jgi:ribosome-binding ATPase YchF (GTP1/OBG family)
VGKCYKALDLISFFTMKGTETRAWSLSRGTRAAKAAGKIHSDMERGFIKADVINYSELEKIGSYSDAKEHGRVRSEGKDYEIKDGDIVLIRFNV